MSENTQNRKIKFLDRDSSKYLVFHCPGCKYDHVVMLEQPDKKGPTWQWNKSEVKPTVAPSLLNTVETLKTVCHLFIEDGYIRYLSDCTHELAGKKIQMEDINENKFK